MKIIDLLNKIANGEEVQQFEYYGGTYRKSKKDNKYWCNGMWFEFDIDDLNTEVEIIEEPKGVPEKLEILNANEHSKEVYYENYSKEEISLDIETLQIWVNKIIDYLDYLESKGDE